MKWKSASSILLPGLLVFAALFLVGCVFEKPLTDKPTRDVDKNLIGSWFSLENGNALEIYSLSPTEFLVMFEGEPYTCTHSDFAGTSFISCRYVGHKSETYGLYAYVAYKIDKDELVIQQLTDDLIKDTKAGQDAIRKRIEEAVKAGKAFNPEKAMSFRKKKG